VGVDGRANEYHTFYDESMGKILVCFGVAAIKVGKFAENTSSETSSRTLNKPVKH
jgi:hypothetical protein